MVLCRLSKFCLSNWSYFNIVCVATSGTLTILARGAATEGAAGGLQVLLDGRVDGVPEDTWVDVPVLPGGVYDGEGVPL